MEANMTEANTTSRSHRIARTARAILNRWSWDDPAAMTGWETMTVSQLHGVCDPNVAFDDAAKSANVDDADWDHWIAVLDDAQAVYDAMYAAPADRRVEVARARGGWAVNIVCPDGTFSRIALEATRERANAVAERLA